MATIWLVEDDADLREITLYALQSAGYTAEGFDSGDAFLARLHKPDTAAFDLLILDVMMPGIDGLGVLKKLRDQVRYQALPIIMLTAKGSEHDKVKGLDGGADDYVTKPYGVMELLSRIKALLRRAAPAPSEVLRFGDIALTNASRSVTVGDAPIGLTFKEFELLHYLLTNARIVLPREKILSTIWGYDFEGESRTLDMHIKSLRQKLGPAGASIKTVRNVGYTLGE